jgi:hypothetical protein
MGTKIWNIAVSDSTDLSVRSLFGADPDPAQLSQFVEEAVKSRIFERMAADIKSDAAGMSSEEIEILAKEAVDWARAG